MKGCLSFVALLALVQWGNAAFASEPTEDEIAAWAQDAKAHPELWGRPPKDGARFFAWVEKRVCAVKGYCMPSRYPDEMTPYSHDENGCSSPTGDLWFRSACNTHDNCYQHGFQCGLTRKQCDDQFLTDMFYLCQNTDSLSCYTWRNIYYFFVRALGRKYYHVDAWTNPAGKTLKCSPEVSDCSTYKLAPVDHFCKVYLDPPSPTMRCPSGTVTFTATGGRGRYVWSTTAGTLTLSGPNNEVATLAPPDPGGEGGELAFSRSASTLYMHVESWPDCTLQTRMHALYNCAGEFVMCYQTGEGGYCGICAYLTYPTTQPLCQIGPISYYDCGVGGECPPNLDLCEEAKHGVLADHRHDQQNLDDCHPCVLEMAGAIVTVTDRDARQAQARVEVQ